MARRNLLKKVAPVVMSAAVAFSSMPATAFASDFADSDVVVEEEAEETDLQPEAETDEDDATEVVADEDDGETLPEATQEKEDAFVSEESEEEFSDAVGEETAAYVLMNIPYDQFYKAELKNNDVKVDTFTSATKNKSRTKNGVMANGSYHVNADGSDITGVTFPVKVNDISALKGQKQVTDESSVDVTVTNRGQTTTTTYKGSDALFESASYSYYVLASEPGYYKELTVNEDGSFSFSAVKGQNAEAKTVNTTAQLKTQTGYGDYQLDIDQAAFAQNIDINKDTIYGATVNTTDGTNYGLRHVENMWKGFELAWCTGFTTAVHGCPTSSEHYKSMMGKTIDSVTYYTDKGIVTFDIDNVKVLTKTGITATAENIHTTDTTVNVALSAALPADFNAKYAVDGTEVTYADGKITTGVLEAGSHTLVISDADNNYASIETTFSVKEAAVPAVYDDAEHKLAAAKDVTEEGFAKYVESITSVTVGDKTYAASGKGSKVIVNADGTLNTADLGIESDTEFKVTSSKYDDLTFTYSLYSYVYAGLSWSQYWSAEDVYKAGDASSSDKLDGHSEYDRGGFDTVTRATFNHGLHRGSYQCMATIYTKDGNQYQLSYWKDGSTPVLTDGTEAKWTGANRETGDPASIQVGSGAAEFIDHYVVTGIKYVPVRVAAADYKEFAAAYPVVKNGETLAGGYSENNLKAYTETANVTANTNGLKIATKNEDGSFSFSARQTGTDSGIKDQDLKVASDINVVVQPAKGSYGEFLRVDLTGAGYGALGAAMQTVKWEYYGNSDSVQATYGTKFAADNWMHKAMGIQLGLTDSVRCQLPEGTDGTGHWKVTVYALGYQDYTFEFDATAENVVIKTNPSTLDVTAAKAMLEKIAALNKEDYTADSWAVLEGEVEETQELIDTINKAIEENEKVDITQAGLDEQVNDHLTSALNSLVKVTFTLSKTSGTLYVGGTEKLTVDTNLAGNVTWTSSNTKVATVADGKVTAKAAGTARITATVGGKTATYTVTVKKPSISATVGKVYVGKTAKVQVKKYGTTAKVSFKSSNTKIATVNKSGVVTGKKAGTVKITVTAGKLTKTVTVKVAKPSFTLAKSSASIKKGKKVTIKVKAAPSSKVTYKTSNKSVATVSSKGVVTGKKKGTAKITVKCNGITRTFKVTVK